ncbi:hypothetical protein LTR84_008306 [Exophiala bonariae]|uniref:Nephrocystin 3-like N-terminal domain-containing protein n=1 Tax=Exophiala bonariae TaxID=1690606 RepID=A0AAV9MZX2_9EURO|nr:hypothetical protein LTR84_008306 [Exophiala bonariae]
MKTPKSSITHTGLTVLYHPDGTEPNVDIVFVHGLKGHPRKTWEVANQSLSPQSADRSKHSGFSIFQRRRSRSQDVRAGGESGPATSEESSDTTVFWPLDLLPSDCPTARILTFGYDTQITKGYAATDKSSIFSHGRDFLLELSRERGGSGRPLIMVTHSLGGIVVKEALRESEISDKPDQQDILNSTAAVVFFGTPHRGSGMAGIGHDIAKAAGFLLRIDINDQVLRALDLDSPQIELCNRSFIHQWNKWAFQVKTFQESNALTGINFGRLNEKVVLDISSSFGDPREDTEKIQGNHREMCRFVGSQDPGYRKAGPEIKRLVKDALTRQSSRTSTQTEASEFALLSRSPHLARENPVTGSPTETLIELEQRKKEEEELKRKEREELIEKQNACLRSLAFPELWDRERDVETALADTCEWLFREPFFRSWMHTESDGVSPRPNLLWIKGKPGAGKSTLMKAAFHRAKKEMNPASTNVAGFFFSSRRNIELERTLLGLLRTLLHQLLQADENLMANFLEIYTRHSDNIGSGWQWHISELLDFFSDNFKLGESRTKETYVFIDALDECEPNEIQRAAYFFRDLSAKPNFHVCLSSRHFPHIKLENALEIVVEEGNSDDIAVFIRKSLAQADFPQQDLEERIIKKASGVFLWVALVVDILNKNINNGEPEEDILMVLNSVPDKLDDLFKELFTSFTTNDKSRQKIECARAANLIQWMLLAARPLRLKELHQALAFSSDPPMTSFSEFFSAPGYFGNYRAFQKYIRTYSRGLVEVSRGGFVDFWLWLSDRRLVGDEPWEAPGYTIVDGVASSSETAPLINVQNTPCGVPKNVLKCAGILLRSSSNYPDITGVERDLLYQLEEQLKKPQGETQISGPADWSSVPHRERQRLASHFQSLSLDNAESLHSRYTALNRIRQRYPSFQPILDQYFDMEYDRQIVQVIHESVREFFLYGQGFTILDRSAMGANIIRRQAILTAACVNCVGVTELQPLEDNNNCDLSVLASPAASLYRTRHEAIRETGSQKQLSGKTLSVWINRNAYAFVNYSVWNVFHHSDRVELSDIEGSTLLHALQRRDTFWLRYMALQFPNNVDERMTPLYLMCEKRSMIFVRELLQAGVDPNEKGGRFRYPIIAAMATTSSRAQRDYFKGDKASLLEGLIRTLLEYRADPNLKSNSGESVLHYAVATGNAKVVELLVEAGALVDASDSEGRTPLHEAACFPAVAITNCLLSHGAQLQVVDADGNSPLHLAAKKSSLEVVQSLLKAGSHLTLRNRQGARPLDLAAESGRPEILEYLCSLPEEQGSEEMQSDNPTLLHLAAENGNLTAIRALLTSGADRDARDRDGRTALHVAAFWAQVDAVGLLSGCGNTDAKDVNGQTALHLAAKSSEETLAALLSAGADVDAIDNDGRSPLHVAAKDGTLGTFGRLLDIGANTKIRDKNGRSARYYAQNRRSIWLLLPDSYKLML